MHLAYKELVPEDMLPGGRRNSYLTTEGQDGFDVLGQRWEPYLMLGDGFKALGYRRSDGAGYVLPVIDNSTFEPRDCWYVVWSHPGLGGRPGWHHNAFGTYATANCGALAFDTVYALERYAGNKVRCPDSPTERT